VSKVEAIDTFLDVASMQISACDITSGNVLWRYVLHVCEQSGTGRSRDEWVHLKCASTRPDYISRGSPTVCKFPYRSLLSWWS